MRRAFAGDTADMLLNDPWMLERFPDPADRIAKAERLQVLAREYAQEKARTRVDTTAGPTFRPGQGGDTGLDITQMDPGSMPPGATELPGGGSYRVLDEIDATKTGPSAFTTGKRPESMAVLQRNDQAGYPIIARNVIGNMWQDPTSQTGEIGPIQTANSWMPNTKGGISENAKGILANDDGQVVARGNLLAEGGNLLREQIAADKGSRTMPMMATAMLPLTAVTSPGFGLPALGAAYLGANAASGETFARYLARTAPQQAELLARKGVDSAMIASGQMADDEAMAMRAPVNPVEGGAAAYNQASGIARGAYDKLPRGTFWMPPVLLDQLYGP
jgi:hypothetical protein